MHSKILEDVNFKLIILRVTEGNRKKNDSNKIDRSYSVDQNLKITSIFVSILMLLISEVHLRLTKNIDTSYSKNELFV